ncbi:thymidine kinase [Lactobacillus phage ATCC 8014-B2]|uniref:thymidine kinase n=1 Tax=Lactobacillus phage ATCC 8014-B2 TaxID=1225795 RepID=K4HZW8_9CAUD|nr:thymidine kinase [Lactobacillus phage ATCC 8014-B2]AFU63181.1 thymidine kinase [Lactobacillus phage ATCC 8014-B2]
MIKTLKNQKVMTEIEPQIRFYYGTMRSGKTEKLLNDSLDDKYRSVFVLPEEDTSGIIESRAFHISDNCKCGFTITPDVIFGVKHHLLESMELFRLIYEDDSVDKIVIDEAQFLNPEDISDIVTACRVNNKKLDVYGLLTDFHGNVFDGSRKWIDYADESICIEGECEFPGCSKNSHYNCMMKQQKFPNSNIVVGDSQYIVLCPEHRELYKKAGLIEE